MVLTYAKVILPSPPLSKVRTIRRNVLENFSQGSWSTKKKNKINKKINKVEIQRHVNAINKEKPARGAIFRQDLEVCDVFRRDVSLSM